MKNGREKLSENKILSFHCLYSRHKAYSQWEKDVDYPDFNQIQIDQSFNWSAFSYPVWTRFNPEKEYMPNYGIMSYKVFTIKNLHKYSELIPKNSIGIEHAPEEYNYSHCQLYPINSDFEKCKINREKRRELRHILSRRWVKKLEPYEEPNKIEFLRYFSVYIVHRASLYFSKLYCKKTKVNRSFSF